MKVFLWLLGCVAYGAFSAQAADGPIIAREQILIMGVALQPSPAYQAVPKNTATAVKTLLAQPNQFSGGIPPLPADALVFAELRGPAFGTPVTLTARPNESIPIPPLALTGLYTLGNIHLVSGGQTLLQAIPDTVTIEVIDKVLVSQVTSRPLTAQEIKDKGIVIDQTNFQVVNFTAAFGLTDNKINIDFPMIIPSTPSVNAPPAAPPLQLPTLQPASVPSAGTILPQLQLAFQTPNVSVSGLLLRVEESDEDLRGLNIPPIPGVIIIPGNIAYLNQFFSVLLMVSNVAPGNSNLVVRDITAEIILPPGNDTVLRTGDDPLRMARLGNPPVEQSQTQPVAQPGPDGKLGTPDDISSVAPGESGNGEFLVEGRKEGVHTVEMKISGFLYGLPVGPVKISGRAVGVVEVRNPTFALTLSHTATATAGEEYDFLVTVTNTSETPANFVSLNLLPRSISGAVLAPGQPESIQLETIAAGDSETVTFRLVAQTTGTVTATSYASDDIPGKFELHTAVGGLGIPMSPNTLVLPPAADALPAALRNAGIGLLGQAYALATSPVTPKGLLPITQQIVFERATDLAGAGQRVGMREPLSSVARDLALDFMGNNFIRIGERFGPNQQSQRLQTEQNYQGFDELLRQSKRGAIFLNLLGNIFAGDVQSQGALAFQKVWTRSTASRPSYISAITGSGNGPAPVVLNITNPDSKRLGLLSAGGEVFRNIPYGTFFSLIDATPRFNQMGLIAVPTHGTYTVEVTGTDTGTFDLGLVVPEGNQLRRLTYEGVAIQAGGKGRVHFIIGGDNSYILELDETGEGQNIQQILPKVNELVTDTGPTVISAIQVVTGKPDLSQFGQLIGLLFSEEISKGSSQDGLTPDLLTHYRIEENQVLGASLQPGGRVVLLTLRDGIGPFIPRSVTVSGIEDRPGNPMVPAETSLTIVSTMTQEGGTVSGQVKRGDGTPVPHARIGFFQTIPGGVQEVTVSVKDADPSGRYVFDYMADNPSRIQAIDLESGESGEVKTQIRYNGQHLDLDIILLGTGRLVGKVFAQDGTTLLPGAVVKVSSLTKIGEVFVAVADASGVFSISGIPVGNVTIEAVHVTTQSKTLVAGSIPTAGKTVIQDLILLPLAQAEVKTGGIKGQVFRSDGVTIAEGIPVYTNRGGLATTDATGSYRIEGLLEGPIEIKAIDQVNLEQGLIATTIVGGQEVTANLLLLGGTGTVKGVVLNADGIPVAGAIVGGGLTLVRTDTTGQFTLSDVPVGQRTITALDESRQITASATVNLASAGEEAAVQILFAGRGTLAGQVFEPDGKTPVHDLRIILLGTTNLVTVTDFNGGYRFENIPLGSYMVSAFRPGFSDGNVVSTKLVFKDEVRRADVIFRGKGKVSGIILAADGVTPLGATVGFSELKVKTGVLRPPENTNCFGDITVGDQTIEVPKCLEVGIGFESVHLNRIVNNDVASGTFAFDDVFVGGFTVEAANGFSPTIMAASGAISKAGETAHVVLQLTATSVVKGTVFLPDGITPVGKDDVITFNSGTLKNVKVVTDEQGKYLYPLVNAGGFDVTAEDPITGLVGQSRATVDAGRTAEIPIRLLGKGTVTVQVAGSNGVIEGAIVTLQRGSFPNDQRQRVTGPDGKVTFDGGDSITEGPFSVSAFDSHTGIRGFNNGVLPGPDAHADVQILLPDEAGTVRGRFLKTDGVAGIPNAQIRLASSHGEAYTTSGADGGFVFLGVPKGGFALEAFDPTTARRGQSTGEITVNLQDLTVNIIEIPQGMVKGFVRLSKGLVPVSGAEVSISVSSVFGTQLRTTSGVDGAFSFPGVSAGNFTIYATDPVTQISGNASGSLATEGQVVEVEVNLQVPQIGRVEGFVKKADGSPAQGAQVTLNSGPKTTTDNSGFYFFENIPVGSVSLLATALAGNDTGIASGQVAFDGDVERVDIELIGTGSVTGMVKTSSGEAVPFARVVLSRKTTVPRSFFAETQTDLDGRFQFTGVLVGDVSVTATQSVTQLAGSASGTLSSDGTSIDLQVILEPAAELKGRVLREDGVTLAGGMALELTNGSKRFGATASDGAYDFKDLSLGNYKLTVTDPLGAGLVKASATLSSQGQVIDLGDLILDESPPHVVSTTPANGVINVPVNQVIQVLFSEPADSGTVTSSTVPVSSSAGIISGTWTMNAEKTRASFIPSTPYRDFSQVTVKVTTGVKDRVGKSLAEEVVSTFITADSTPPATLSVSPSGGARNIALESVIRAAYSEAIDPAKFGGPAILLSLGGIPVAGRMDFILNNTAVVFTPNIRLAPNAIYQVSLLPATDLFGNSQTQGTAFTFATLDTEPPVIQAVNVPGGTIVKEGTTVSVQADLGSVTDAAFVEFRVNGQLIQTVQSAPFAFNLPITSSFGPTVIVGARATDLSGNAGQEKTVTLTVQADAPPVISITSPADGSVVNTGSRMTFNVHAVDDFGVTQIISQATGAINSANTLFVTPASLSYDAAIPIDVPANLLPGSTIVLKVTAIDTSGKPSAIASISLVIGDATPPIVRIVSPAAGSLVNPGETVNVLVTAQDNGMVSSMSLQASGVSSYSENLSVSPPSSNVATTFHVQVPPTAAANQTLTLTVQAQDSAGNSSSAGPIHLAVRDVLSPVVMLVLKNGATEAVRGKSVVVVVSASDDTGVANIAFQTLGSFVTAGSMAMTPPLLSASAEFVINVPATATEGSLLTIVGTANDASNNTGTSAAVSLPVVSAAIPVITGMTPAQGSPGSQMDVLIEAENTNFVQGQTLAGFGTGINVNGSADGVPGLVTVESPTRARVQLDISLFADFGKRTVTLSTGNEQGSLTNGFNVIPRFIPAPLIIGPLAAGSKTVTVGNLTGGSEVRVYTGNTLLATQPGSAESDKADVVVPILIQGERISARQVIAGIESASSVEVVAGSVPAAPRIIEPLFAGGTKVKVSGLSGGALVNVMANGVAIGTGTVPLDQSSFEVPLNAFLTSGAAIMAVQTFNGVSSSRSRAVMVVDPVPPRIRGPLAAGVTEVTVEKGVPGAQVQLFSSQNSIGSALVTNDHLQTEVGVSPLTLGGRITATQSAGEISSPGSLEVVVGTIPPAPTVSAPIFTGGKLVIVEGTTAGATVQILINGAPVASKPAAGDHIIFSLSSGLNTSAQVTASQTLAGVTSSFSEPVTVATAQIPMVVSPLGEGSQTLSLFNLIPGSEEEVQANGGIIGLGKVLPQGDRLDLSIPPRTAGDSVTARQSRLDISSPETTPLVVGQEIAAPEVDQPLFAGGRLVRVLGVTPGAVLQLIVDGISRSSTVVPDGATDLDISLASSLLANGIVTVTQTLNGHTSLASGPVQVTEATAPVLPLQVLTTESEISISGVFGGAYVALLADGVAVAAGVVSDGEKIMTLPHPHLVNGTVLTARQAAFGVVSPLSTPVNSTNPPPTLTLSPSAVTLKYGASASLNLVSSIPAPAGGLSVTLTAVPAGIVSVTSPMMIPEGETQASIPVNGMAFGSAVLTAEAAGFVGSQAQITVVVPKITGITPSSGLQGSILNATIQGENLEGVSAITFTEGGLTGSIQAGGTGQSVPVTIVLPPDAPIGAYSFTLILSSGGIDSGAVRLNVGTPFNGQTQAVSPPVSVFFNHFEGSGVAVSPPVSVFFNHFEGSGVAVSPPVSVFFNHFEGSGVAVSPPVSVFYDHFEGSGVAVSLPVSVEKP